MLSEITGINKKYEKISDILGDRFNIFKILNLKSDELSHSKFIAELLNPKGSHGKGKTFLDLFLEKIGEKDFYRNDDPVTVETEKVIGYVTSDSGGRIDILITSNSKQIIIENKIYAVDQPNQLLRYRNYKPKARLIYLTLEGRDSGDAKEIEYTPLSYSTILIWLDECRKEAANHPILRETLTQYILLIKDLIGLARSDEMKDEYLKVILKDEENFSAALDIANNINEVKKKAIADKFIPALENYAKNQGWELSIDETNYLSKSWGFTFKKGNLLVEFEFQAGSLNDLIYGIGYAETPKETPKELNKYVEQLGYKYSDAYLLYKKLGNFEQLLWTKMYNIEEVINIIRAKVEELEELYDSKLKALADTAS
jgi:hypothetical protein